MPEGSDKTREHETDWRSYAAGYQAAVFDLTDRDESPSILPYVIAYVVFVVILRYVIFKGE